jgi:uncharacterized protein (TIGR03086 family)
VLLRRSVEGFGARVGQIGDDQWEGDTPDTEWNVRDLVSHVLSENLWAPPLFAGSTISEVGDRFDGDVLGTDPHGSWRTASVHALEAADEPGAMDRTVHLSFGDFPGREYAMQLFADHLIHAWDLARAIARPGAGGRLHRLVRADGGRLPRRRRDRRAAAGPRRRRRADAAAGHVRPPGVNREVGGA